MPWFGCQSSDPWIVWWLYGYPPPCREAPVECHNPGVRFLVLGSGILELFSLDLPGLVGITRMIFLQVCFCCAFWFSTFSQFNKKHPQIKSQIDPKSKKSAGPSKRGHQAARHLLDPLYLTSVCDGIILQP